ncbi:MAG: Fic family protein [Kiritimatiellae bacterium]|nr:Fic family protein [Kiritimatiellia bacterium]
MPSPSFNWQRPQWPAFSFARSALKDELAAFARAFREAKKALREPQDPLFVARALASEAVTTRAIEGVEVDEAVVMSSICRALGVPGAAPTAARDAASEGAARLVLAVREDRDAPLSAALLRKWHGAMMEGGARGVRAGAFRDVPVRVVSVDRFGQSETRFEAPPPERVAGEIGLFVRRWRHRPATPEGIALKAALMHPHFESIHPFEDGNGRIGRALVAKVLAEGLRHPVALPVSTFVSRHRRAYYDEINVASHTLDWTSWAGFFVPVLTDLLESFVAAMRFVAAKRDYLARFESSFAERARKVVLRMFEDGEAGAKAGLSAAKWMRMAKVSKPTATRDLAELVQSGAIVPDGTGPQTRYLLNHPAFEPDREPIEPINDGINDGINAAILRLVRNHPGRGVPFFLASVKASRATVERAVRALVRAGRIEHRGSRKTGGYFATEPTSSATPPREREPR